MKGRSEISENNKYHISKYRYLELKNFCMQYPNWVKTKSYLESRLSSMPIAIVGGSNEPSNPTAEICETIEKVSRLIDIVDESLSYLDEYIRFGIKECITQGVGYDTLRARGFVIPCGRVKFYEEYRRFFYILSHKRD